MKEKDVERKHFSRNLNIINDVSNAKWFILTIKKPSECDQLSLLRILVRYVTSFLTLNVRFGLKVS